MERLKQYAKILVGYSIKVRKGDVIQIKAGIEAEPLILEIYEMLLKKGAIPKLNLYLPGQKYKYFRYANIEQLKHFPKIDYYEERNIDGSIIIITESNTRELTNIPPEKISIRSKVLKPLLDARLKKKNWVLCAYPTNALAQDAEMSLEEFRDFVYDSVCQNWYEESKRQDKLKKILDKGKRVSIIGEETELEFGIKGRKAIKCDGHYNMPDGEVFIAPEEKTVNGKIFYSFPAIYNGREVSGIRLEFKNGKVIKAKAEKNEEFLKTIINTDNGSKYLGEFGIGTNYKIKKFIKNILFDEKIGGTIHLALGNAYKEGGGRNSSSIHWDMIKDLRHGGEIYVDDILIQKNGKFKKFKIKGLS